MPEVGTLAYLGNDKIQTLFSNSEVFFNTYEIISFSPLVEYLVVAGGGGGGGNDRGGGGGAGGLQSGSLGVDITSYTVTVGGGGAAAGVGSAYLRLLQKEGFTNILTPTRNQVDLTSKYLVQRYLQVHLERFLGNAF